MNTQRSNIKIITTSNKTTNIKFNYTNHGITALWHYKYQKLTSYILQICIINKCMLNADPWEGGISISSQSIETIFSGAEPFKVFKVELSSHFVLWKLDLSLLHSITFFTRLAIANLYLFLWWAHYCRLTPVWSWNSSDLNQTIH